MHPVLFYANFVPQIFQLPKRLETINFDDEEYEEKTGDTNTEHENNSEPSHSASSGFGNLPPNKDKFRSSCHNPALALATSIQKRQNQPRYT